MAKKLCQNIGEVNQDISNDLKKIDLLTYFLKFEDIVTKLSQKLEQVISNDFLKFDLLTYFLNIWDTATKTWPDCMASQSKHF